MWGLSIQRQIARSTVFSLTYNGNHGVGLMGGYDANQVELLNNGFADAFKVVQAGGDSPLMNSLLSKWSTKPAGQTGSVFARTQFSSQLATNNIGRTDAYELVKKRVGEEAALPLFDGSALLRGWRPTPSRPGRCRRRRGHRPGRSPRTEPQARS